MTAPALSPSDATSDTLKASYARLEMNREPFMQRARACSALTIPTLVPPKGHTPSSPLPTPFQSTGARCVNTLTAKILLAVLPPNQPNFRLSIDDEVRAQLGAKLGDTEKALNKTERAVARDFERGAVRPQLSTGIKHLLVGGNILLHDNPKTGKIRVFPLTKYVVERDPEGTVLQIIVQETVAPAALPTDLREAAKLEADKSVDKTVEIYTGVRLEGGKYVVHQEVCGVIVPGSQGSYPVDSCPWIPVRLIIVDGEDYGRGYVEEYIGDIKTLETLQEAMVRSAVAASKIVFMVNPNGVTDESDFSDAEGGDTITGVADDITTPQIDKRSDFQMADKRIEAITEGLSYVFLLNSAIQRKGERVTAEEIRYMANELDSNLGGIYSALSPELQAPLVRSRMANLQRKGKIPKFDKDVIEPTIVTGIDAIGRGNDLQKMQEYLGFLNAALGPEKVATIIHAGEVAARGAAATGIDPEGLIKTEEEQKAESDQAQQAQMMQAAVAPTINQAGQAAQAGQA